MPGIYLHIPFCKKACHYCDFHFSTSIQYKTELLRAMHSELKIQKAYLQNQPVETIYFGGGTPSLLSADEIECFIDEITKLFSVQTDVEITVEANPDDLTPQKVKELRQTNINRFSIGIQSFFEEDLVWMNRAHHAPEAESAVKRVQDAGFENITADLIYGYPLLTREKWETNILKIIKLDIPHVSAYAMTVEPATALASFIRTGEQKAMDENQAAEHFVMLTESLQASGFEHYEISNFAKPGRYSRHNSNYWKGVIYLGIGPSAHSFNGDVRQWNISNNALYMQALAKNNIPAEQEILTIPNRVNEYIMTSLRTIWGIDLAKIGDTFGPDYRRQLEDALSEFLDKNQVVLNGQVLTLTAEGKLFADHIASQLFVEAEAVR